LLALQFALQGGIGVGATGHRLQHLPGHLAWCQPNRRRLKQGEAAAGSTDSAAAATAHPS
jgi:hypothetical protein